MSAEVSAAAGLEVALAQDGADAAVIETILILRAERCTVRVMGLPPGTHTGFRYTQSALLGSHTAVRLQQRGSANYRTAPPSGKKMLRY